MLQATEAIKLILKIGKPLIGQFLIHNALEADFKLFTVRKSPSCPLCNGDPKIRELADEEGGHEACELRA